MGLVFVFLIPTHHLQPYLVFVAFADNNGYKTLSFFLNIEKLTFKSIQKTYPITAVFTTQIFLKND